MTTPNETAGETAAETVLNLRRQIQFHDHRYYNLQHPTVSDAEYDNLMEQLRRLEKEHPEIRDPDSPTRRVGGTVGSGFAQVEHPEPMLSLANAATQEEFGRVAPKNGPAPQNRRIYDDRRAQDRRAGGKTRVPERAADPGSNPGKRG